MWDVIAACLGVALVVTGVALLSIPAAFIVAGVALTATAVLFDLKPRGRSSE